MLKQIASPAPWVFDSVGLGVGPGICISIEFQAEADITGLETTLWESWLSDNLSFGLQVCFFSGILCLLTNW